MILTEDELKVAIKHALNEKLSEEEKATYECINEYHHKKHLNLVADSDMHSYITDFIFHCQNLRGTAAVLIFSFEELYSLQPDKAILKGTVFFNNEERQASITVKFINNNVFYSFQHIKIPLQIDPSKKELWEKLINEIKNNLDRASKD